MSQCECWLALDMFDVHLPKLRAFFQHNETKLHYYKMMIRDKFKKVRNVKLRLDSLYVETTDNTGKTPLKEYVYKRDGQACCTACRTI